jgi:ribose-phosphate pyrophosphokinase
MIDAAFRSAALSLLDLDLASTMQPLFEGGHLPLERWFIAPRPDSLAQRLIEALTRQAAFANSLDIYAPHTLTVFASGEHKIEYTASISGKKVFLLLDFPTLDERVVPSTLFQMGSALLTNNYLFLAQQASDAARRCGAKEVHLLMPNYAYARQDKTHKKRAPISASITARNMEQAFDSIASLHLHSPAIEGMVRPGGLLNIPPHEIFAPRFVLRDPVSLAPIGPSELTKDGVNALFERFCIVSPDAGGMANARDFAHYCQSFAAALLNLEPDALSSLPLASIDKRRTAANVSEVMNVLGAENVRGRIAEIFDDMGDTFGTCLHAVDALLEQGAKSVRFCGTHGYFSGPALERLSQSPIEHVVVSNSMALRPAVLEHPKISVVDIAPALAQVVIDRATARVPNLVLGEPAEPYTYLRPAIGHYAPAMLNLTYGE